MTRPARRAARAFTLMDLLMTMAIMVIASALVLPQISDERPLRLEAAARLLTSDLELAQVLTLSSPAAPVVVRFDPAAGRYWLARAADPDTPIPRGGTGEPCEVRLGHGRAAAAAGITLSTTDIAENTLEFNEHGGIAEVGSAPIVRLSTPGRAIELRIAPATGTVMQVQVALE
jgi:Tfp pilus assembly protein FimT